VEWREGGVKGWREGEGMEGGWRREKEREGKRRE
jgi:hypothetical protein